MLRWPNSRQICIKKFRHMCVINRESGLMGDRDRGPCCARFTYRRCLVALLSLFLAAKPLYQTLPPLFLPCPPSSLPHLPLLHPLIVHYLMLNPYLLLQECHEISRSNIALYPLWVSDRIGHWSIWWSNWSTIREWMNYCRLASPIIARGSH